MTLSKMPRGYRNNNPLNIRRTAQLYGRRLKVPCFRVK